ncbi:ATP-dependent RNA helicase HrpA [Microbacterium horticulturae]|uniref:ATP-dependent RNA helicase HrpA n=1 Tax=Microbacterium horticulturae TaxID=3028316 RepID=A0ABY8C0L2_9MICO|nr:ATP-dependent RNA helicase HrpA [Microbacterium sp. KACC 23027]WEG09989.1 ATP-dependent RNA helicase HrpA [Microbacterium sp. KACC 23027]
MSAPEPVIAYPPELPVSAARDEIARAIADHQVVIVAGATGSGKTTQLPKICLELGRTRIAHTQPRRIAARSIAERVAEELQVPLGSTVGYKVRFTDKVTDDTRITLMTDGILLNEIHRDRQLGRYDTIIVDEAHERSLNVDFLIGYLRRILPRRPDLKVIITSATIDPESFAKHFAEPDGTPAPIIEVSGRTYPVEIRYRPPAAVRAKRDETPDDLDGLTAALRELDREPAGDVLVFLPGEAEIRDAMDAVRGMYAKDAAPTEVLPLYGRLSAAEQHRVFERSTVAGVRRRVILSTNVAETSLTVPGIRYVVDAGTARISRYSNRSKIQRLPIEPISQASAMQRSGRAGRTAPGIAIRLYAEDDFQTRPEFTQPEVLRTSLASVVLQMLSLGFGDIADFPFLTPPDSRGVKAAFDLLVELGAVTTRPARERSESKRALTDIGRELARLPIDPRFARMLLEARRTGVLPEVRAIVAGMSIPDVRERPEERREEADRLHARFADPTSDFLSILNLWNHLQQLQHDLGSSAFRRTCRAEHLNYVRVREWFDVHRQLGSLLKPSSVERASAASESKRTDNGRRRFDSLRSLNDRADLNDQGAADPEAVHKAILSGLLSQIGVLDTRSLSAPSDRKAKGEKRRKPRAEYLGARGARFQIFPGSALRGKSPQAVMAAELVETSRLFARTVAVIDPEWAEPLAGDLARRQLSDPHWSKDAGAAVAAQKVTLFGVEIIPRRRVQLARFDQPLARELFVRHALVEGEWDSSGLDKRLTAFERRNLELRRRLEKVEERERRRDILAGDEAVFAFYDARLPRDVFDARSFENWWREASGRTPHLLDLTEADLVDDASRADARDFPTRWTQGDQVLSLAYRFEPGAADDGVTVVVPLALLAQLRPDGFDWQVPGMRDELITALIRALPKSIRRHVVPAADWASRFAEELADQGPESHDGMPRSTLREALADRIRRVASQPVTAADFDMERVPGHLLVSFRAVDARGRAIGSDRDLGALQSRLAERSRNAVSRSLSTDTTRSPREERSDESKRPSARGSDRFDSLRSLNDRQSAFPERAGMTTWDIDEIPEVVDTKVAGGVVRGYPALVDDGTSVSARIEATPEQAAASLRAGVRRLVLLSTPSPADYVLDHLTSAEKLALAASPYPSARAAVEDCRVAVADAVIARTHPGGVVRTRAEFDTVREAFAGAVMDELFAAVSLLARILTAARDVERTVKRTNAFTLLSALGDIKTQLAGLVFSGFVSRTGLAQLAHLPRYLQGALIRLQALSDNPGRDRQRQTELERALALYEEAGGVIPPPSDAPGALIAVRWMLEEYRVSLFAQTLGTAQPVSLPRIVKALGARAS